MHLTNEDVQDILHLLDTLPFGEFHLRTESFELHLRRAPDGEWTQATEVLARPQMLPPAPTPAGPTGTGGAGKAGGTTGAGEASAAQATGTAEATGAREAVGAAETADTSRTARAEEADGTAGAAPRDGLAEVRSPLPGTFYRAPNPGAPPFVEVGSEVGEHTVVGIIETMKLMNSVSAGIRGTVAEICLADAEFAGQDAVLMRIERD